jgi:hypothetical protein
VFLIDEAVLLRQVGSPAAMERQLRHLQSLAQLPNISIRVMPLSIGRYSPLRSRSSSSTRATSDRSATPSSCSA